MNQQPTRRRYARETHYPVKFHVCVTAEMGAAIRAEAEAENTGAAIVMRAALDRGMPLVRDANRKRRKARGKTDGKTDGKIGGNA